MDIDIEIPFKETEVFLKQLNVSKLNEQGRAAFDFAFTGYFDPEEIDKSLLQDNLSKARKIFGPNYRFDRSRARRFAGDKSLPRSRYYTLAHDESGFDDGTLVNEMRTYYNPIHSGMVQIFDLTKTRDKQIFEERGFPFGAHNLVLVFLPQGQEPHPFARKYTDKPTPLLVELPLLIQLRRLTKALDLRIPDVADWFARTFSQLKMQIGKTSIQAFPFKLPLQSFREIIPAMLSQEVGGGGFCKVVGLWCRRYGVEALIYPSARTDCSDYAKDNQVISYSGWNMVDYAGTVETWLNAAFDATADWPDKVGISPVDDISAPSGSIGPIWFNDVRIEYTESGTFRGSWHVEGLKKRRDAFWRFNMAMALIKERSAMIPQSSIETVESWLVRADTADLMGATSNLIFEAMMGIDEARKNLSVMADQFELKKNNEMASSLRDLLKGSSKR